MSQPNKTKDHNQHDLINICNIRTGWKVSNWLWIKQCIKTSLSSKFSIEMFIPADPHQSSLALEVWQQLLHPILVWKQMLLGSALSSLAEILPCDSSKRYKCLTGYSILSFTHSLTLCTSPYLPLSSHLIVLRGQFQFVTMTWWWQHL